MVDPVNLNVPGFDYLFFALLFVAVVALFTLLLARAELALRRKWRARATGGSVLLESRLIEGSLEWVDIQDRNVMQRARAGRTHEQPQDDPGDLIEEAED